MLCGMNPILFEIGNEISKGSASTRVGDRLGGPLSVADFFVHHMCTAVVALRTWKKKKHVSKMSRII